MIPRKDQLRALAERDPALGRVMETLPPFPGFPVRPRLPHFHALARIIIYQQLASGAARSIHQRVKALSPDPRRFPTAAEFASIPGDSLREAGLSRNKLKALQDLASRVQGGHLKLRSLFRRPDPEVMDQVTAVWGMGEWSAQMFLLFHLGRLDVFAPGDLGLREGIRRLDGLQERPIPSEASERALIWAPLRSVASWFLWRLTDTATD